MSRKIEVVLVGDAERLIHALHRSSSEVNKFGRNADGTAVRTSRMTKATHAFKIAGLAAIPVVGFLAYQLHGAVQEAADTESAMNRLEQAVTNSGQSWKKLGSRLDEEVKRLAVLSGMSLPDTADAMAKLELSSGNAGEAVKLTNLAMDIARGRNMTLAQTSVLVSKAYQGNVTGLKKLGIALPEISDKLSKTAARQKIINFLSKKFGGDAKAYGKTAQGSLDKLNTEFSIIKETIGKALLPIIKKLADKFGEWISKAGTQRQINRWINRAGQIIKHDVIPAIKSMKTAFDDVKAVVEAIAGVVQFIASDGSHSPLFGGSGHYGPRGAPGTVPITTATHGGHGHAAGGVGVMPWAVGNHRFFEKGREAIVPLEGAEGRRAMRMIAAAATSPEIHVHNYFGNQEMTHLIDSRVEVKQRGTARRLQAGRVWS